MKRGQLWQGIAVLIVLGVLAWLSGALTPLGLLVFAWLFVPAVVGGLAAATLAARYAGRHVIAVAKLGTIVLTAGLGAAAAGPGATLVDRVPSRDLVLGCAGIQAAVGAATCPFFAARAVYQQARRNGSSVEEARALSRWDPDRF
jgi:hypothetical protein